MARTAFVSHASQDAEVATQVVDFLESEGISCWVAPRDLRPGQDYGAEIMRGIAECRVMVLVLSEHANSSTFVKREVERGVSTGMSVFPVRVREVLPSQSLELFIASCHWIDAWQPPLEQYLGRLAEAIRVVVDGEDTEGVSNSTDSTHHYMPGKKGKARKETPGKRITGAVVAFGLIAVIGLLAFAFQTVLRTDPDPSLPEMTEELQPTSNSDNLNNVASDGTQPDISRPVSEPEPGRTTEEVIDDTRQEMAAGADTAVMAASSTNGNRMQAPQILELLEGQSGRQRYDSIQTIAPLVPEGISAEQMMGIIGSSSYRLNLVKQLKDRLSTPLSFQDTMTILEPTRGRERYDTIQELPAYMPDSINVEQLLQIIETSSYRLNTIKQLKNRLPTPLTFEETMRILQPTQGRERYDTIQELPAHIPDSLTVEQFLQIIETSSYRLNTIKQLKGRLPTPLSFEETMKILAPTQGRERYDTILELPGLMPERITVEQLVQIIETSSYRKNTIELLKDRLPVPITYQQAEDILAPSGERERYDIMVELADHLVGLTPGQVEILASKSTYSDRVRDMLLNRE